MTDDHAGLLLPSGGHGPSGRRWPDSWSPFCSLAMQQSYVTRQNATGDLVRRNILKSATPGKAGGMQGSEPLKAVRTRAAWRRQPL